MPPSPQPHAALERVDLAALDARPLRVTHSPLPSVLSLVSEALGRRRNGAPEPWRRAVRSALTRRDILALLPVFGRDSILLPDCLLPLPGRGVVATTTEIVEQIAATDPGVLLNQAAAEYGAKPPPAWGRVEDRPERWLEEWAVTIGRVADAVDEIWRTAQSLIDRETERIGVAAAVGASREVLATLHAKGRVMGDELVLDREEVEGVRWKLADDGLVLVPMLGGTRALVSWHRDGAMTHLAYPLPGQERLLDKPAPDDDRLANLLGAQRAGIMRLLDHPVTAGAIAEAIHGVRSAATHHVGALESAGLVERERRGQHVYVRRTARGTALLALYERAP